MCENNSQEQQTTNMSNAGVGETNGHLDPTCQLARLLAADVSSSRPIDTEDISLQTLEDQPGHCRVHLNRALSNHNGTQLSVNRDTQYAAAATTAAANQTPLSQLDSSGRGVLSKHFRELSPEECYRKKCRLSRIIFRLCCLALFLLLGLPCNLFTMYCLTNPVVNQKNISSNETVVKELLQGTDTSPINTSLSILQTEDDNELPALSTDREDQNDDISNYVCFENVTTAQKVLKDSRYWIEGVAIFIVTVVGLLGKQFCSQLR